MRPALVLVILAACAGGQPAPARPVPTALPADAPPPRAPAPVAADVPAKDQAEVVAIGDTGGAGADPCDGGEIGGDAGLGGTGGLGIRGTGQGGGGIGVGTVGTIGSGIGSGYGSGAGRPRGAAAALVKLGVPTVAGKLDKNVIRRVVRQHLDELRYCYERALAREPAIAGTLTATFVIDATGNVTTVAATGVHAEVDACVAHRVRGWRFPKPSGGSVVSVSFPIAFAPPGG